MARYTINHQICFESTNIVTTEDNNDRVVLANVVGSNGSDGGFLFTMIDAPSSIVGVEYHL